MSERKLIKQITTETENAIKRKGALSLPDRPSDENMNADDVRKALFEPILDTENSAVSEIKRVVQEGNIAINDLYDEVNSINTTLDDTLERVTSLENSGTVTNATYAQYASTDTSKGTIEERLTNLGFKQATITWLDSSTKDGQKLRTYVNLDQSYINLYRYGNYVTLDLKITFNSALSVLPSIALGTIPIEFMPSEYPDDLETVSVSWKELDLWAQCFIRKMWRTIEDANVFISNIVGLYLPNYDRTTTHTTTFVERKISYPVDPIS